MHGVALIFNKKQKYAWTGKNINIYKQETCKFSGNFLDQKIKIYAFVCDTENLLSTPHTKMHLNILSQNL